MLGLANPGQSVDLQPIIEDPANFALVSDCGGFVLIPQAAGHYEVHSMFLPGNGTAPIRAMRAAQDWIFTRTDCVSIWSRVPASNKAAKGFAIAGKLTTVFERDDERFGPTEFVELPLLRWAMQCGDLEKQGERFHALLVAAKAAAGSVLPEHPHDAAHERAVGAALLMFERGQPQKAAAFYNLWANIAGYQPIALISLNPVTVDAGDAILGIGADGMEILKCR
tara:strand:+ start:213 stop:884 length:672 start_codon:yes stop_codon:yes gene_type:complete